MGRKILYQTLFLTILLTIALQEVSADSGNNTWNLDTPDKQVHFFTSYGLAMTSTLYFRSKKCGLGTSILLGSLTTLAIGITKERFLDPEWSQGDVKANVLGTAAGALFFYAIEF